jgi:hypothetical protein
MQSSMRNSSRMISYQEFLTSKDEEAKLPESKKASK